MNRMTLDDAPDSVRSFLLSLDLAEGGVALELAGKTLCEILPPSPGTDKESLLAQGRRLVSRSRRRNADIPADVLDREIESAIEVVRNRARR